MHAAIFLRRPFPKNHSCSQKLFLRAAPTDCLRVHPVSHMRDKKKRHRLRCRLLIWIGFSVQSVSLENVPRTQNVSRETKERLFFIVSLSSRIFLFPRVFSALDLEMNREHIDVGGGDAADAGRLREALGSDGGEFLSRFDAKARDFVVIDAV